MNTALLDCSILHVLPDYLVLPDKIILIVKSDERASNPLESVVDSTIVGRIEITIVAKSNISLSMVSDRHKIKSMRF